MKVFLYPLLVSLFIAQVYATVLVKQFEYGKYTIRLTYDNLAIDQTKIVLAKVDNVLNVVDFVSVYSSTANSPTYACRQISQQRIIYGPIGCSNIDEPNNAIVADNCFRDDTEVDRIRDILYKTWHLNKESSACRIEGGGGDIRLCAGPLRLAIDNKDAYLPKQVYGVRDFLASRMRFVECLTGPFAMSPCVVEIRMVLPAFYLDTNCSTPVTDIPYNGSYTIYDTDAYPGMISDVFKAFEGPLPQLRLMLKRDESLSTSFRIVLGKTPDANTDFVYYYESELISQYGYPKPTFFLNWIDLIQNDTEYVMSSGLCWLKFIFPTEVTDYTILAPDAVRTANYSLYQLPSRYYTTRICNFQVCGRDATNQLTNAYCEEGDVAGGDVVYADPRYPHLPIYVPPNPNLDFRFDCDEMYPAADTFPDLNNITISRMNIQSGRCFAPFLDPELIRLETVPYQREIQCQKMGGFPYTRAKSYCSRPIIMPIRCKQGWIYFDQKCFYKFDPNTETRFSNVLDQGDEMCALLSRDAQAVTYVDSYLEIFLRDYFIYWKRNALKHAAYRIPVPGSSQCSCFTLLDPVRQGPCPCFESQYDDTYPIFPICFYPITTAEVEPAYSFNSLSYETARLYTYGQEGPFFGGYRAQCRCFPGWTGIGCETPTCPLPDILISYNATELSSSTLSFFRRCMSFGRGRCNNGNPRICECLPGFGPSASSLSSFPELYEFNLIPCNCPASASTYGPFQIDTQIYAPRDVVHLPCNGIYSGRCVSSNDTSPGYCICTERPNILLGGMEPSFDGDACTSSVPVQTYLSQVKNGPITTALCNHKGVSCPSGQTISDPVGDIYNPRCFSDEDGSSIDGCVCDNGWGGGACTCPVPVDYAYDRILERTEDLNYIYLDMGFRYFIFYVRVTGCTGFGKVSLSNEIGKPSESVDCVYNSTYLLYDCYANVSYQYIVLSNGKTLDYERCYLEAYQDRYSYCGANHTINPFAGRFFDIAAYRGFQKSLENQNMLVSIFGCTNTDCMCNSNFTGPLCGIGVSSIRPEIIEIDGITSTVYGKTVCGRSTLNPDLLNSVAGRGEPDYAAKNCSCNPISSVDPTGKLGLVTEIFTGRACQCATGLNRVINEIEVCSGHGNCTDPSFPYGQCEVDLDMYVRDALYTPFVEVTEAIKDTWNFNTVVAETDTFFVFEALQVSKSPTLSPTKRPTLSPTKVPTRSPTKNPTRSPTTPTNSPTTPTKSPTAPTQSPTYTGNYIYLFSIGSYNGNMGGSSAFSSMQTNCYNARTGQCSAIASNKFFPLLYTSTSTIDNLSTYMTFSPSSPVFSAGSSIYLGTWDAMLAGGITTTMNAAGVSTGSYWTGNALNDRRCGNSIPWSTSSGLSTGLIGNNGATSNAWIYDTLSACSSTYRVLCACLSDIASPTLSPTTNSPTSPTNSPTSPTQSPTVPTQSPTMPTNNPTTLSPTTGTQSPTVSSIVVLYYGGQSNGNIGNRAASTAICQGNLPSYPLIDDGGCLYTPMLLSYDASDEIQDFPTIYSLSTSAALWGIGASNTLSQIGIWSTAFSAVAGNLLTMSLSSANVLPGFGCWYSGSTAAGAISNNCASWTSGVSSTGFIGSPTSITSTWLRSTAPACSTTCNRVCACIRSSLPGTPSPTQPTSSPTPPTESPTLPTSSPTSNPTLSPSRSPTTSPTFSPTQSPSMLTRIQIMYRLPAGAYVDTYRSPYNVSYLTPNNAPPVNLTIKTSGTNLEPIAWQPTTYRVWNYNTNVTSTLTLTDPCNPANPSPIPGTAILQQDGVYQCPTNIPCILTSDCTDELAPADAGTSMLSPYTAFPDLRACLCSFTVVPYPTGLAPFYTEEYISVELFNGSLSLTETKDPPQNVAGSLKCNNFVHRTINCQLMSSSSSYPDQCSRQPIKCNYNSTIGRFFGGFHDQNPNYRYDTVELPNWNEGLYRGVASLLNYLFYMDPVTGQEADPFLEDGGLIWDDYDWINTSDTQFVQSVWRTTPTFYWYQAQVIQGDPYMYSDSDIPPPIPTNLPNETEFDTYFNCLSNSLSSPTVHSTCYQTTWANSSSVLGRQPGLEYYYNTTPGEQMLSATVEITATVNFVYGVEVYNSYGDLCGTALTQNFSAGQTFVFLCPNNTAYNVTGNGVFRVRFVGPSDIYDLPETTLNRQYLYYVVDALYSGLDLGYYTSFLHTSLALAYPLTDVIRRYLGTLLTSFWPTRIRSEAIYPYLSTPFFRVQYNYTAISQAGQDIDTIIANVYNEIVQNNTYPYNYALAAVADRFATEPIDYQNPIHLAYLQKVYLNYLTVRRCGAEDVQCQTFNLGTCLISTKPGTKQRWYNAGSDANYLFEGQEGGCNCLQSYTTGYFSFPTSCQLCESGYGPLDLTEMRNTIVYNQIVTTIYPSGFIPQGDISASLFESNYICRFPFSADPVLGSIATLNICAGHGLLSVATPTTSTYPVRLFTGNYISRCNSLVLSNGDTYIFDAENTTTVNTLLFNGPNSTLSVIGAPGDYAVYKDGTKLCVFTSCQDSDTNTPWLCSMECEEEASEELYCENEYIYSTQSVSGLSTSVADLFRLLVI